MDAEEITKTIKELKDARSGLKKELKSQTQTQIVAVVFMSMITITCVYWLTCMSIYAHVGAGIGACLVVLMTLGLWTMQKDKKVLRKQVENTCFLESYWKGALWERGYDWRKVDGNV